MLRLKLKVLVAANLLRVVVMANLCCSEVEVLFQISLKSSDRTYYVVRHYLAASILILHHTLILRVFLNILNFIVRYLCGAYDKLM